MVYVVFKMKSRTLDNVQKFNNYIRVSLEGIGFESEAEPNSDSFLLCTSRRILKYVTTDFAQFHFPAVSWQKLNTHQSVNN
jgi:hypothetical protein